MTRAQAEIWQAAGELTRLYGEEAPTLAARKVHLLLEAGEIERRLVWLRIMAATKALLTRAPSAVR